MAATMRVQPVPTAGHTPIPSPVLHTTGPSIHSMQKNLGLGPRLLLRTNVVWKRKKKIPRGPILKKKRGSVRWMVPWRGGTRATCVRATVRGRKGSRCRTSTRREFRAPVEAHAPKFSAHRAGQVAPPRAPRIVFASVAVRPGASPQRKANRARGPAGWLGCLPLGPPWPA